MIPALNEALALPVVLAHLPRDALGSVIVVDNGSTDGTAAVAQQYGGAVVVREASRGYGAACLAGIAALAGESGRDIVVFLDADGSSDPACIPGLVAPIVSGHADLVIGSRTLAGGRGVPMHARLGNALAVRLIRWRTGATYTDLGPLRALRLGVLRGLNLRDRNYGWNVEMQLRAARAGVSWIEVPVLQHARVAGESKISGSVTGSMGAGAKILWAALRYGR